MDKEQLAHKFILEKWLDRNLELAANSISLRVAFVAGYDSRNKEVEKLQEEVATLKYELKEAEKREFIKKPARLFEIGEYWVAKNDKHSGYDVFKCGVTHSVRCAIIGYEGDVGFQLAMAEARKRHFADK
jgi:hypothetical protein